MPVEMSRRLLFWVALMSFAWLASCAVPGGGDWSASGRSGAETRSGAATIPPEPIFTHNLSVDKGWSATPTPSEGALIALLDGVVENAKRAGYRRVMLARPLPRGAWVHRAGAEPLEQLGTLEPARRAALEAIVGRHPGVEFSTHLGYERLVDQGGRRVRQAAAWEDPGYVSAIEREVRGWNDLGYFVWLEGIGGPKPGGRSWHLNKPEGLRVGGIVWPMGPSGSLIRSDQSPMLGDLRFLEGKEKAGHRARGPLFSGGAERYVALSMQSADHLISEGRTEVSPFLASLLEEPNVGLVCFNMGRRDQRMHERIMEVHHRRVARFSGR